MMSTDDSFYSIITDAPLSLASMAARTEWQKKEADQNLSELNFLRDTSKFKCSIRRFQPCSPWKHIFEVSVDNSTYLLHKQSGVCCPRTIRLACLYPRSLEDMDGHVVVKIQQITFGCEPKTFQIRTAQNQSLGLIRQLNECDAIIFLVLNEKQTPIFKVVGPNPLTCGYCFCCAEYEIHSVETSQKEGSIRRIQRLNDCTCKALQCSRDYEMDISKTNTTSKLLLLVTTFLTDIALLI